EDEFNSVVRGYLPITVMSGSQIFEYNYDGNPETSLATIFDSVEYIDSEQGPICGVETVVGDNVVCNFDLTNGQNFITPGGGIHQIALQNTETDQIYEKDNTLKKFSSVEKETSLELRYLRPIKSTQNLIKNLRQKGEKIIFISDMYLPSNVIRDILLRFQIAKSEDPIYVSSEIGFTKKTGNLFKYVLKREGIKPHQLHHYGDNIYRDVMIPRKLGIKATYYKDSQLNRYEESIVTQSLKPPLVHSQIAGISRAVRLEYADDVTISKNLASLATNVIAPLLTSYVAWVLEDAYKKGIERLYFVARDGQILLKIAHTLAKYQLAPECRYLYASPQVLFLASITEVIPFSKGIGWGDFPIVQNGITQDSLDWLFIQGQSNTLIDVLKRLNIEPREIENVLKKYNFEPHSWNQPIQSKDKERFWKVLQHPEVKSIILRKAKTARDLTLEYLSQEGLFSSPQWALVDLGWTLKCQRSLKQLLNQDVTGYYFGILRDSLTTLEAGAYKAFLQQDVLSKPKPSQTEIIFRNQSLIQQVFTIADHPTVIGYAKPEGDIVKPVLKSIAKVEENSKKLISSLHQKIIAYAEELGKTHLLNEEVEELKRCAVINTVTFLSQPNATEVQVIKALQTAEHQNESQLTPIACQLKITDIPHHISHMNSLKQPKEFTSNCSWIEGSIALSNPLVRLLFFLLLDLKMYLKRPKPLWIYSVWFYFKKTIGILIVYEGSRKKTLKELKKRLNL
ncbi:MAG: hypothetical protein ACLFTJ_11815, partial [Halothece sp.]